MHVPVTPHARTHPPVTRTRRREERVLAELRRVLAGAGQLPLDLLGDGPVRDRVEAAARVDALARELVARMAGAGWAEGAAPSAVTSVLAASVPEAETVLLRAARARR
jgi:hypothetical protein